MKVHCLRSRVLTAGKWRKKPILGVLAGDRAGSGATEEFARKILCLHILLSLDG